MRFYNLISRAWRTNCPEWNYYRTEIPVNPLISPERCIDFIQAYFAAGEKGFAVTEPGQDLTLSEYRAVHTVSAFFLGVLVEDWLRQEKTRGVDLMAGDRFYPFSYLWFLTCLYHDFGYTVEEHRKPRPGKPDRPPSGWSWSELANMKRRLQITLSPYCPVPPQRRSRDDRRELPVTTERKLLQQLMEEAPSLRQGLTFDCGVTVQGFTYPSALVAKYFSFCARGLPEPCYNHGILGGYLFYDRMIKSYLSHYQEARQDAKASGFPPPELGSFDWNGRHFSRWQPAVFAHVADCIIAHNIWKGAEDSLYSAYGLDALTGERFSRLSLERNPLLFLLAVADTVEPCKLYCAPDAVSRAPRLWNALELEFHSGVLRMGFPDGEFDITPLWEKAKGLEDWTEVLWVKKGAHNDLRIRLR